MNCGDVYEIIQKIGIDVDVEDINEETLEFFRKKNHHIQSMVSFLEFFVNIAYDGSVYLCYSEMDEGECFYAHTLLSKCVAKCLHKVIDDLIQEG